MENILTSEFSEITYVAQCNAAIIKWLPENRRMAELDFRLQVDTLFSTAEVFKAGAIYIDALEFDYPLSVESIKLIKDLLSRCMVKVYSIIESKHLMGRMGITQLFHILKDRNIHLNVFKSRDEGDEWLSTQCKVGK